MSIPTATKAKDMVEANVKTKYYRLLDIVEARIRAGIAEQKNNTFVSVARSMDTPTEVVDAVINKLENLGYTVSLTSDYIGEKSIMISWEPVDLGKISF